MQIHMPASTREDQRKTLNVLYHSLAYSLESVFLLNLGVFFSSKAGGQQALGTLLSSHHTLPGLQAYMRLYPVVYVYARIQTQIPTVSQQIFQNMDLSCQPLIWELLPNYQQILIMHPLLSQPLTTIDLLRRLHILLCLECRRAGLTRYVDFSDWLISLRNMH